MHFFSDQHHSVYFKCGGFTYVSVSASACKNVRLASRTMNCLSSLTSFWQCCSSAHHLTNECQWWCSCEVTASPFLFDLMRDQSTSHIHTFAFTFVDVSPSTRNGFASCPKAWNLSCHLISSPRALATSSLKSVTLVISSTKSPSRSLAQCCRWRCCLRLDFLRARFRLG